MDPEDNPKPRIVFRNIGKVLITSFLLSALIVLTLIYFSITVEGFFSNAILGIIVMAAIIDIASRLNHRRQARKERNSTDQDST